MNRLARQTPSLAVVTALQLQMAEQLRSWNRSTFGLALLGAVVLWAALPPLDLWPLGWVAPVWWVILARGERLAGRRPYMALWLAGFLFWMAALHFLRLPHWATSFGWVALSLYLAFYLPLFVGLVRVAGGTLRVPVILAAPVVWTGLELARAHLLTGITMASLGHTQYRWIELIQLSDLAGAYGVSFLVMFVAACLARMLPVDGKPPVLWPPGLALAVLGVALLYGYLRTSGDHTLPGGRIALVQGSIDTELKSDPQMGTRIHDQYRALSEKAIRRATAEQVELDLMVWPETMFRTPLVSYDANARMPDDWQGSEAEFRAALEATTFSSREAIAKMARGLDVPLILGVDRQHFTAEAVERFNSAVLVSRDGELLATYDKMHLVLFGEYVPLARRYRWLQRLTPLPVSLTPGTRPAAFDVGRLRIAPNICYEDVLPHVIRRQLGALTRAGRQPDVLVNLTNDGWFWGSSELDMHLICGVFRAVECRKPLLIAANTGFSAWIDGDGRILRQGRRRATDTILADVRVDQRDSWYLAHGDLLAGLCLAACVVLAGVGGGLRIRDSRRPRAGKSRQSS